MHKNAFSRQVLALGLMFAGTTGSPQAPWHQDSTPQDSTPQVSTLQSRSHAIETIVVRRGDKVFDVTVSNDITDQRQRWNGLRDRAAASVTLHVVTGKGYKSYVKNFCYRYQPNEIYEPLIKAFDSVGNDLAIRKRAAMFLNYFGDHRGVDWVL